ncbi:MAG: peptide chain release factor 2 [Planctomycetes bacterium]|nr:peptide chain release factor 2 [Planctomycetota bacterium]
MNIDLRRRTDEVFNRLTQLRDSLDLDNKRKLREKLTDQMGGPGFWDNQEKAQQVIAQLKPLNGLINPFDALVKEADDLGALCELCGEDDSLEGELQKELYSIEKKLGEFDLRAMFTGGQDSSNAFLQVSAGTGGTEACDWAQILLRMYTRWAERHGYTLEMIDELRNEEAGIRSATILVKGDYAYGYLQSETGVHRLVRISPFDANARRHTSFAAVNVTPDIEGTINIEIKPDDLKRDTFRSGGPGGQHQNKTESGVRYTHIPSGIAAESRTERSQHKNDANAMALLKAKMYRVEEMKRKAEIEKQYDEKGEVSWGSQIRNYVMQPYTLVKDVRTDTQSGQIQAVLDGEIDDFIQAYLRAKAEKEHKK